MDNQFDCIFKIILVGDTKVGKSALLEKYTKGDFYEIYKPTYGLDFKTKMINIDGKNIQLQIWDTPGQKKFKSSPSTIYNNGYDCIVFIYNVTNKDSFSNLIELVNEAKLYSAKESFSCIVGSKIDIEKNRQVQFQEGLNLAQQLGIEYFEVSFKENKYIEDLFLNITKRMLLRQIINKFDQQRL